MSVEIGNKYGSWTVIAATTKLVGKAKHKAWICQCDCERKTKKIVSEHCLTYRQSQSCGKCPNKGFRTWMPRGFTGNGEYRPQPEMKHK